MLRTHYPFEYWHSFELRKQKLSCLLTEKKNPRHLNKKRTVHSGWRNNRIIKTQRTHKQILWRKGEFLNVTAGSA